MKKRNEFFEEENQSVEKEDQLLAAWENEHNQKEETEEVPLKSQKQKSMNRNPGRIVLWRVLRPMLAVVIGLAIVGGGVVFAFDYVRQNYFEPADASNTAKKTIVIPIGSSLSAISDILEQEGIIQNASVFKYYVDFTDMTSKLLAGQFELSPSMTMDDIIDELKRPTAVKTTTLITFIEGTTIEDMAGILVKEGIFKNKERFLELCRSGEGIVEEYPFLEEIAQDGDKREYVVEGYLFPDTYEVFMNSTEEQIIDKLLDKYDSVWAVPAEGHDESRDDRAKELGMTQDEVMILASIIEKEAKRDDFAKVSAVFHNRLRQDMKLESCATHQYFMEERRLVWNSEELKIDSPYNTYKYAGLPLGPICNPSRAAIDAALYPNEEYLSEGYLFFCLGDPATGELFYAKTNKEHEQNKAKYQSLWAKYDKEQKS